MLPGMNEVPRDPLMGQTIVPAPGSALKALHNRGRRSIRCLSVRGNGRS
jgi:hypothetical protein